MKLSKLINILTESLSENGDMEVEGIVNGTVFPDIEINCPGSDSPMYIELYEAKISGEECSCTTCFHNCRTFCDFQTHCIKKFMEPDAETEKRYSKEPNNE